MSRPEFDLADLPWLPRPAPDFSLQLRAIVADAPQDWGLSLRALASRYLNLSQALALARAVDQLGPRYPGGGLDSFRLGLVGNSTHDFLKPMLVASAIRYGICLTVVSADFDQGMQEALDPKSKLNSAHLDGVLLAFDHRGLPFRTTGAGWPLFNYATAIAELDRIRHGFRSNSGATCFVQTIPSPAELLFGSLDVATDGTLWGSLSSFNSAIARSARERGDVVIDVEWLANCVGLDRWHDDRLWHMARVSCSQKVLPLYADFICRPIAAMRGKSRKCLVLDLDNTLWGGVIGDDGLDGIELNPGDARGEAYRAVQQAAADLRTRGVLLAICSKNDDATARRPFREHGAMILREADISIFVANWNDKASNLRRIAQQLGLGIDSLVLLDDNPAERAQVRLELPQVAVPELGDDPSTFARTLLAAGYFESIALTADDLSRARQYRVNAERIEAMDGSSDMSEFLRSLQMEIGFAPFSASARKRITQLVNKTNQFNLTTRRYTELQIAGFEQSRNHYTLQVTLRDRFGDNGMICVLICEQRGDEWEVDTWLMSCRVLNRGVEQAVCNRLASDARRAGARRIVGRYIPSQRNGIVRDLFQTLGFVASGESGEEQCWVLELEHFAPTDVAIFEAKSEPGTPRDAPS